MGRVPERRELRLLPNFRSKSEEADPGDAQDFLLTKEGVSNETSHH